MGRATRFCASRCSIFDANIYYPFANTLAYSENLIGSAFFAAPIIWLTGDLVLAMNLTALLTCVLCGTGAYLLARHLHLNLGGAFICGLIFAFAPPRFFRMGQLHMTAVQWIPFSLAFLHAYFERGRRRDLLLAIGFLLAAGAVERAWRRVSVLLDGRAARLALRVRRRRWRSATAARLRRRRRVPARARGVDYPALSHRASGSRPARRLPVGCAARHREFSRVAGTLAPVPASDSCWGPFAKEPDAFLFPGILVLVLAAIAVAAAWPAARLRDNYVGFYLMIAVLSTMMFVAWPVELWRYVTGCRA